MDKKQKLLTLETTNETITFAVSLDWLKDRFNVLTKKAVEEALKLRKISIEEIYKIAGTDEPKQSGFRFIESKQKVHVPEIIVEHLGQAILLDWDEADNAVKKWCEKQKLGFCGIEKSDKDIMICIKTTNYSINEMCKKVKKLYLKYDPYQETFDADADFNPETWEKTYKDQTILYLSEKVSQNILFKILKKDQHTTYRNLYALDEYILLTEK